MKLGLFGGAFDPIHYGHLLMADQCREQCCLDEIWFIPLNTPSHKRTPYCSPNERITMLELATENYPEFRVNPIEIERGGVSYTIDTVKEIKTQFPNAALHILIAEEWLLELKTWKNYKQLFEFCDIIAVNRGGKGIREKNFLQLFGKEIRDKISLIRMPGIELASSDIRTRLKEGKSIRFMTPKAVEDFILREGLYSLPLAPFTKKNSKNS